MNFGLINNCLQGIIYYVSKAKNRHFNNTAVAVVSMILALVLTMTFCTDITWAAKKTKVVEIKEPVVSSSSYIVLSGSTSERVYSVHEDRKLPIGSITKLMTAMVVIDNIHDDAEYNNKIIIDSKVAKYGSEFKKGDSVKVRDLLYAMIIGGSDQAAEALARYSASDRKIFISEMNSKAMELGLMSTQYANPTGQYDDDHYSTAYESAIVAQAAMRYELIKKAFKRDSFAVRLDAKKRKSVTFTNTNPLVAGTKSSQLYNNAIGGILGTLDKPGRFAQYIGIANNDGMQLIVVMLEANQEQVAANAIDLFEYGYYKVTKNQIVKADKVVGHVRIKGGAKTRVAAYTEGKGYAYIPPEGSTDLVQTEVYLFDELKAPMKAGTKVGEYRIYVADELKGTVDLVIKDDIKKGWVFSNIYISNFAVTIVAIIIAMFALVILRLRAINKRRAKIRAMKKREKIRELARKQEALDRDRKMRKWTYSKYYDSKDINDALKKNKK